MYNVLIVDDEASIRKGLGYLIDWNSHGFQIGGEASNGLDALGMIKKEKFDVLISDIRMPKMNGLELARHVNEMAIGTKVILISGYRDFEYARTAIEYGVTNYVLKPINEEMLVRTLEKIRKQCDSMQPSPGTEEAGNQREPATMEAEVVSQIEYFVQINYGDSISLITIAKQFNYNHVYLGRLFFKVKGETFRNYLNTVRVKMAERMIREGKYKMYEISDRVGYKDINYFCKIFKKTTGMTPGEYKSPN